MCCRLFRDRRQEGIRIRQTAISRYELKTICDLINRDEAIEWFNERGQWRHTDDLTYVISVLHSSHQQRRYYNVIICCHKNIMRNVINTLMK